AGLQGLPLRGLPEQQIKCHQQQETAQQNHRQAIARRQRQPALTNRHRFKALTRKIYTAHASPPRTRRALTPDASRLAEPSSTANPASISRSRRRSKVSKPEA